MAGSISVEASFSVMCSMRAPSYMTCRCPCRLRGTGVYSSNAARSIFVTLSSIRAETISSMSKWSSERTHPRQMLVRVMSGWPAKDVQIAWSLVDGKPPHGACLSLSVHGMTGRLNALSVVSTLAKSLLMSERITS